MRKLTYHIATSLDNYIAHEDGSCDAFFAIEQGSHVQDFMDSWANYDTVLMGSNTYEFGYSFGLQPGQPAYPNMKHYIFSKSLDFRPSEQVELVRDNAVEFTKKLKAAEGKTIWLCGGSALAADFFEHELIDELVVKLNPLILGNGLPLFGNSKKEVKLDLLSSKAYDTGVVLLSYKIDYQWNRGKVELPPPPLAA